jgi:hypothetical protein
MAIRIVLIGKSKSGRTWAADYIRAKHHFRKMSLGDGVTRIQRILYYYGTFKRVPWERKLEVYDALYKIDPTVWIGYLERKLRTTTANVVVDDPRYLNELSALKELGFTVIRLTAPETRRKRFSSNTKAASPGLLVLHEMFSRDFLETAGVDYSIYNETKDGTRKALDEIIEKLKKLDNPEQNIVL